MSEESTPVLPEPPGDLYGIAWNSPSFDEPGPRWWGSHSEWGLETFDDDKRAQEHVDVYAGTDNDTMDVALIAVHPNWKQRAIEAEAKVERLEAERDAAFARDGELVGDINQFGELGLSMVDRIERLEAERDHFVNLLILRRNDGYEWGEVCVTGNYHLSLATNTAATMEDARASVLVWARGLMGQTDGMTPEEIEEAAGLPNATPGDI